MAVDLSPSISISVLDRRPSEPYQFVPHPDGSGGLVPLLFEATFANVPEEGQSVALEIRVLDDGPVVTEARFRTWHGPPITPAVLALRGFGLSRLVKAALDRAAAHVNIEADPAGRMDRLGATAGVDLEHLPYRARGTRRRQGSRLTDEDLERVAAAYREAVERGEPPKQVVAAAMGGRAISTAGRYIVEARKRGFLGKSLGPGRVGEQKNEEDS